MVMLMITVDNEHKMDHSNPVSLSPSCEQRSREALSSTIHVDPGLCPPAAEG